MSLRTQTRQKLLWDPRKHGLPPPNPPALPVRLQQVLREAAGGETLGAGLLALVMLVVLKVLDDVPHITGFDCWGKSKEATPVRPGCARLGRRCRCCRPPHGTAASAEHHPARAAEAKVPAAPQPLTEGASPRPAAGFLGETCRAGGRDARALDGNSRLPWAALLPDPTAPVRAHPNTRCNNAGVVWGDKIKLST